MNLKKVWSIYNTIKERLPKTYPRPKLVFFEDEECMLKNQKLNMKGYNVYAVADPNAWTISLPLNMTFKYKSKNGQKYQNTVPITKVSDKEITLVILHELGHLFAGERYGYNSEQYFDEDYCDDFADRWYNKMVKEKLLE